MTNRRPVKLYLPIILVFIIVNALLISGKSWLAKLGVDQSVAIIGNLVLFIATFLSLFLYDRAMSHSTTAGFLRNTYSGLIAKLVVCLAAVLIYAMVAQGNVNKQGIFACVFFYFLYTIIEMRSLARRNKERSNA
jgi:F0F1-type ATP synthase assembly protein I